MNVCFNFQRDYPKKADVIEKRGTVLVSQKAARRRVVTMEDTPPARNQIVPDDSSDSDS